MNLVQNAHDAGAGVAQPQVWITASAGEHGVGGVAVTPGEMIAIHAVL